MQRERDMNIQRLEEEEERGGKGGGSSTDGAIFCAAALSLFDGPEQHAQGILRRPCSRIARPSKRSEHRQAHMISC